MALAVLTAAAPPLAHAQASFQPSSEVVIVAASPIPGAGGDRDTAPVQTQVLDAADLSRDGEPNLLRTLGDQLGAVSLESASGNPFQPSLFYHGFEASPLQGTAQGLAVYVDGVRFNQAFGDTVDWDLLPDLAIDRLTVEDSDPLFGLNALGGSIDVQMKTGFGDKGGEVDLSGGSFGQVQGEGQYGASAGAWSIYAAGSVLHQEGWRDLQSSDIQTAYGDLGWRREGAELHLSLRLANSTLNGPGTSPVELLAADRKAQFTGPNKVQNQDAQVALRGDYSLGDKTALQGVAYVGRFRQAVANGNAANDQPCDDGSGLLCTDSGDSATTGGRPIAAFLGADPFAYSELDDQTTATDRYGASAQLSAAHALFGFANHLVAGASFDGGQTRFDAASYIGGVTPLTRVFVGPGVLIDEPGSNVPVSVAVSDAYYGLFASDTLDVTSRLSLTASGRFNRAQIDLDDQLGGDLTGNHAYARFNPAVGAAWRATSWLTAYAGYAEANRAPTPAELSCASPADSCSLANFFVGDPNLKQVTARTVEAGVRGRFGLLAKAELTYAVGLYRTDLGDDIAFVNSATLNRAYFTNVGHTRRQGLDADLQARAGRWRAYVAYAHTDATYQSGFVESGGSNPAADGEGNLTIVPGDRFPGVPADQIKLGLQYQAGARLTLGGEAVGQSSMVLFGDEANLTAPLPGYFVLNLNVAYQLTRRLQVFGRVENATNRTYSTYGTFSPTASVYMAQAPNASNPRSYSPAAPIGGFGGLRLSF